MTAFCFFCFIFLYLAGGFVSLASDTCGAVHFDLEAVTEDAGPQVAAEKWTGPLSVHFD